MGIIDQIKGRKLVQFIKNGNTVITIDCTLKQSHSRKSTPTKFQIETGETISDHIVLDPFKLTLEGVITDSPLSIKSAVITSGAAAIGNKIAGNLGTTLAVGGVALANVLKKSSSPSAAAFVNLLQLQEDKEPFDVLTSLKLYKNMWISNISVPRDDKTGYALMFTVELEQLLLVTPETVNIQKFSKADLAADEANKGKQEAKNALLDEYNRGNNLAKSLAQVPGAS